MRSRRVSRCHGCRLSLSLCCCALLPQLSPRTRVVVLAHRVELTRSTNTGRIVARILGAQAELESSHAPWDYDCDCDCDREWQEPSPNAADGSAEIYGQPHTNARTGVQAEHTSRGANRLGRTMESSPNTTWVLFPTETAAPLEEVAGQVDTLIVPDGTWGQARRIVRRHARCKGLPAVRLSSPGRSQYALRRAPTETGLCTIEAVAEALRILEGDACADQMLSAFSLWRQRALLVRAGAHNLPRREHGD